MTQLRLRVTPADKMDAFIDGALAHGLRIKQLKVSKPEFTALLADPAWVDRYADGHYRGIPLRFWGRPVWTS